jgi:hypothetical protein
MIPSGYKASKLYSVLPTDGSGDLNVVRATTATRVNSSGLIESVASNVPRLDYTNGSCPSILVEPQRTNLLTYSEDLSNVNWEKDGFTISSNSTTSPDGTNTADKLIGNATSGNKIAFQIVTSSIGTSYTTSAYFKSSEYNLAFIRLGGVTGNPYVIYNLSTQAVVSSLGNITHTIQLISNGWYKITVTVAATTDIIAPVFSFLPTTGYTLDGINLPQYTGNGVNGGFVWGAQLEAGSYATSYIPTTSESVTRNADVISKTGISSLIGQTEGTIFVDFNFKQGIESFIIGSGNGSYFNNLAIECYSNKAYLTIFNNSASLQGTIETTTLTTGKHKLAVAYNSTQVILYLDGVSTGTLGAVTFPSFNNLYLGNLGSDTNPKNININSSSIWKERLTNSELATLTTL